MKLGNLVIDTVVTKDENFYLISSPQHDNWLATGTYLPEALRKLATVIENEALEHYEDELSWPAPR